jgi:hypothetical protein
MIRNDALAAIIGGAVGISAVLLWTHAEAIESHYRLVRVSLTLSCRSWSGASQLFQGREGLSPYAIAAMMVILTYPMMSPVLRYLTGRM